ncbi:MAG: hypothetical protein B7Z45_03760, partial [Azorhizobium sp. 12-66-6]
MKTPKKIQDPTEAALSAIQEALTLPLDETEVAPPTDERPAPPARDGRSPGRRPRVDVAGRRAANDDRQTVGQLLSQLQRRSSAAPLWWALAASVVWIVFGIAYAFASHSTAFAEASGINAILASPALLTILAGVILPPLAFFAMAAMVRRSRDLQLIARSMTEVAL